MYPILPRNPVPAHTGEMPDAPRRPGDQILDRYCLDVSPEDRELARERLRALAKILIRIHWRLGSEDIPTGDSTHSRGEDRIPSLPRP